jgi:hypothetical protein
MTPSGDVDASLKQFLLVFFRSPISFHHSPGVLTFMGVFKVTDLWASKLQEISQLISHCL